MATLAVAIAGPALAQRTVTLRLNTTTMPDTVAAGPAADVQVRGQLGSGTALPGGGVIDWDDNTTLRPTNDGGDYWSIDFQIPDDDALQFKFYIGQSEGDGLPGGWEDGDNHMIEAGTGDVTLDLHYFEKVAGDQDYDWRPFSTSGDSVAVWFRTYIDTEQAGTKGLDLGDGDLNVIVRGDNAPGGSQDGGTTTVDWGTNNVTLSRESDASGTPGYALFSGRVAYPASAVGMTQAYKFYFEDGDTADGWEDTADGQNRTFTVPAQDSTLMWKFFGDSPANSGSLVTSNVTFDVDVSPLSSVGLFQISDDFVQVRGGFNGWDCPDDNPDDCLLLQTPGTADFSRQVPITGAPGSDLNYKFYISLNNPDGTPFFTNADGTENFDAGYEEPLDYGGGNRLFTFGGSDQALPGQFFNGVRENNIIADGSSVDVTFTVDMNEATSFQDAEGRAFNPAIDTVSVQFEDSFWLLTQGLSLSEENLIEGSGGNLIPGFKLTDDDGDLIYTGVLTINGPTYNGIGYRYTFANDTDGFQVEGQGGFDAGRRRYRYVTDVTASEFAFARDTYRPATVAVPWEINPTGPFAAGEIQFSVANGTPDGGVVANEDGPGQSGTLALGAVYPNPTTGMARFAVTSAPDELVTIRVYDVTGRVVADVVEGGAVSGRVLEVDTAGMAAGLYLVRAESAAGVAVRRLTVVR